MPRYEKTVETIVFWIMALFFVTPLLLMAIPFLDWCCNIKMAETTLPPVPSPKKAPPPKFVPVNPEDIKILVTLDEIMARPPRRINSVLQECLKGTPAVTGAGDKRTLELFLSRPLVGDQFYIYCNGPDSWKYLTGRAGILKTRNGKQVAKYELFMN
jgi:hypothetical protein